MNSEDFRQLLSMPESDILEFKTYFPPSDITARIISAFANTKGGKLIIGVKEGGEIVGIDRPNNTQALLAGALNKITPFLPVTAETIEIDGKSVFVITVFKGKKSPYLIDGKSYQRQGVAITESTVFAPDVYDSAYEAIVTGSYATTQGDGAVTLRENGIHIGGEIAVNHIINNATNVVETHVIGYDRAFERVVGSTSFVLNQLELSYRQTREQSQWWFRASLIAAGIGFTLIGIGVATVYFGQATAGIITSISSVVPNAAAALFFVQSKSANERVDSIESKLSDAREIYAAVEIIETIDDAKSRDKLKAEIVRKALRFEKQGSGSQKAG